MNQRLIERWQAEFEKETALDLALREGNEEIVNTLKR